MGSCIDYERHELFCEHPNNQRNFWRTSDGCEAFCCDDCWYGVVLKWDDLSEGIPRANGRPPGMAGAIHDLLTGRFPPPS